MIRIKAINYQTCEFQEEKLTPETLVQGGGLIGRNSSCDVVLSSPDVSRVHGRIMYQDGDYFFADLGSTGGSLINGEEAPTNQNFPLKPDDLIRIGGFILLVTAVEKDSNGAISLPQDAQTKDDGKISPLQYAQDASEDTIPDLQTHQETHEATVFDQKPSHEETEDTVLLSSASQERSNSGKVSQPPKPQGNNKNGSSIPKNIPQLEINPEQIQDLVVKAEHLEAQGIFTRDNSEFIFREKLLIEGISLSKHLRQKAVDLCQVELDEGKLCLLVEYPSHFTLWWEKSVENGNN